MALIDCPECGKQVSDRAPTCPHCGVPIAAAGAAPAPAAPVADSGQAAAAYQQTFSPQVQEVEPFKIRIAGRPLPIAGLLFWGGMLVGVIMSTAFPAEEGTERELWRYIPWLMIWGGVLYFAINEFIALIRSRRHRHHA